MSDIELASETELNLYKERIDELWSMYLTSLLFNDPKLSRKDLFAQAYILGFKDADLGRE